MLKFSSARVIHPYGTDKPVEVIVGRRGLVVGSFPNTYRGLCCAYDLAWAIRRRFNCVA